LGQPDKGTPAAFGYALANLAGNVIWAIRLCANDVKETRRSASLIDNIFTDRLSTEIACRGGCCTRAGCSCAGCGL